MSAATGTTPRRPAVPPRLYAIADAAQLAGGRLAPAAAAMAAAGVRWIQLRAKRLPDDELHRQAEACCRELDGSGAVLWINDRPDLAALLPVAGVHLGQHDLPPPAARRVLGATPWIGRSTHDGEQLAAADADPAVDVVALGPVFETASKAAAEPVVGLDGLARLARRTGKPLVAIGGIDAGNAARVLAAGADCVAVLGAVCRGDVERNCRRLLAAVGEAA